MKIKKGIIVIISLALICGIGIWQKDKVIAQSPGTALGEKVVLNEQMEDKEDAALIVNDNTITVGDMRNLKDSYMTYNPSASEKDIIEAAIRHEILYQEAINQGIDVDFDEAQKYTEQLKQAFLADEEDPFAVDLFEYISGLGLTVDEYFEQMIPMYQETMHVGLLRQKIYDEVEWESDNKLSSSELNQEQIKAFNKFYNTLRENAVVEIKDYAK